MRKTTRLTIGAAAMAAAVMAVSGAVQVLPAGAATAAPAGTRVTAPMTITGFDAAVAQAHGYVIRTDAQGREYSVKKGAADVATPDNTVYGNCGSSFMWETGIGNHQVEISTGFDVIAQASVVFWTYYMHDNGGTSSHDRDYGLPSVMQWTDNERWGALTPGPASAWVSTSSEVILNSGALCTSAGPSDSTTIY